MEQRIVEFTEVLRQNGLKVAISETHDAVRALAAIGVDDRELTRATLKATLCKRTQDTPVFDKAFDFFFVKAGKSLETIEQSVLGLDEAQIIASQLEGLSPLARAVVEGDRAAMAAIFSTALRQLELARIQNALQTGFFSRRLLNAAGGEAMRSELEGLSRGLGARGMSARGVEAVSSRLEQAMRQVEEAARSEIQRQSSARLRKSSSVMADKSLSTLSRQEVRIAEEAVRALAARLKARLARRQRSRTRGELNPRLTLRKNLTSGGVPMVPYFRRRRPHRPDVIVLCDVSDSVRNASRLMLLFTWSLQSLFTRVRSFIFVSELGEVTRYFKDTKPEVALEQALAGEVISLTASSNYGNAFKTFAANHLGSVSRKTTVVVIGDGRNNRNASQVSALEDLKRKAKRVVWICTEPQSNWGSGDSEMLVYARAVSQVVTVLNLQDLEQIASQIVPSH